jgi:predicted lipid-binding transport protein (Tim44 family)
MAGGLAGGLLGSMLFGGVSHAAPSVGTGGGMGLLDLAIIGLLLYLAWRFFKKRRAQAAGAGNYSPTEYSTLRDHTSAPQPIYGEAQPDAHSRERDLERGVEQIRRSDPAFNEEVLKETFQDIFFRIQAAWMHRSIDDMLNLLTPEMTEFFTREMEMLKQKGVINRLENIAIRKVEPAEAWQEMGKDYMTILFTANLLDYTVDEKTGEVISGDKIQPVKFHEFWTFSRKTGAPSWELSAVNQVQG